jgi:hypothetical protein
MPTKKKPALADCKETVDTILIEELGIENDETLIPSLEIKDLNPDPDDLVYIVQTRRRARDRYPRLR